MIAALDKAHDDLERARRDLQAARADLAAAYAMPTQDPCTGCHPAKAAAIAAAEAATADAEDRITDATRRISLCEDTAEILDPLARPAPGRPAGAPPGPARPRRGLRAGLRVHPPRREDAAARQVDRGSHAGMNRTQRQAPGSVTNTAGPASPARLAGIPSFLAHPWRWHRRLSTWRVYAARVALEVIVLLAMLAGLALVPWFRHEPALAPLRDRGGPVRHQRGVSRHDAQAGALSAGAAR